MACSYSADYQLKMLQKQLADPETLLFFDLDGTLLDGFDAIDDPKAEIPENIDPYAEQGYKKGIYATHPMNVRISPALGEQLNHTPRGEFVGLTGRSKAQVETIIERSPSIDSLNFDTITTHGELITTEEGESLVAPYSDAEKQFSRGARAVMEQVNAYAKSYLQEQGVEIPADFTGVYVEEKRAPNHADEADYFLASGVNYRGFLNLLTNQGRDDLAEGLEQALKSAFEEFMQDVPRLEDGTPAFALGQEPAGFEIGRSYVNKAMGMKQYLQQLKEAGRPMPKTVFFAGDSLFKNGEARGTDYSAMMYLKSELRKDFPEVENVIGVYVQHPTDPDASLLKPNPQKNIPINHPFRSNSATQVSGPGITKVDPLDYIVPTPQHLSHILTQALAERRDPAQSRLGSGGKSYLSA